jgi:hypothetical protein
MIEPERRPFNWRQFSLSSLLLLFAVVAAFLAGRGSAHREMISELATLRAEIARKKSAPRVVVRSAVRPVNIRQNREVRFAGLNHGPITEQRTDAKGHARYITLPVGKLKWSCSIDGSAGYFYFKSGGEDEEDEPEWEFAKSPFSGIKQFNGRSFDTRFGGPGSLVINADGNAFLVEVGELWLARPVDKPDSLYAIKILRQEKDEAMTVEWALLHDQTVSGKN